MNQSMITLEQCTLNLEFQLCSLRRCIKVEGGDSTKKVKERPFAEGSGDCKFYKPSKIMVLTSFELLLPPS
jgi:hypothetical protein